MTRNLRIDDLFIGVTLVERGAQRTVVSKWQFDHNPGTGVLECDAHHPEMKSKPACFIRMMIREKLGNLNMSIQLFPSRGRKATKLWKTNYRIIDNFRIVCFRKPSRLLRPISHSHLFDVCFQSWWLCSVDVMGQHWRAVGSGFHWYVSDACLWS